MGKRLSLFLTQVSLVNLKKNIYCDFQKILVTHVNDIFTVIDKDFKTEVLIHDLNSYYHLIKFAFEYEL